MRFKKSETGKKYFICPRREDLKCPVSITVDEDSEMIVRKVGEQEPIMLQSRGILRVS